MSNKHKEPLPLLDDCRRKVFKNTASPLEWFIYEHSPADEKEEAGFRSDLLAALEEWSGVEE